MQVRQITDGGIKEHDTEALADLLTHEEGFVWVEPSLPPFDPAIAGEWLVRGG